MDKLPKLFLVDFDDTLFTEQSHEFFFSLFKLSLFEKGLKFFFYKVFPGIHIPLTLNSLYRLRRKKFDRCFKQYIAQSHSKIDQAVKAWIEQNYREQDTICIISGSYPSLIQPSRDVLPVSKILASEESEKGFFRFGFKRCLAEQKVEAYKASYNPADFSEVIMMTDDNSDLPLAKLSHTLIVKRKQKDQQIINSLASEIIA